jgi:putative ABC transport system permease protein
VAAIRRVDSNVILNTVTPMSTLVAATLARPRLYGAVLLSFAAVSLLLAIVGVYGVIAFAVSQRLGEFAIRMALGAQRWSILRLVLRRGLLLTVSGVALGLLGALALSKVLTSMLFEISARDPGVFLLVPLVLAAAALLGAYVAARRATEVAIVAALHQG